MGVMSGNLALQFFLQNIQDLGIVNWWWQDEKLLIFVITYFVQQHLHVNHKISSYVCFRLVATQSVNTSFCFIITNQWSPNFVDLVAKIVKKDYKTLFPKTTSKKTWCGYAKTISIVVHCNHVHGHIAIFIWHINEKPWEPINTFICNFLTL